MKIKSALSFLVAAVMIFSLSACSNGTSASSTSGSSAATATSSSKIKTGGTLKIGTGQSQVVMGYTPKITANAATMFLRCSFDSLLRYDNSGKLVADLAEKWESDATAKTLTFHLRSGVKFTDGTDFNADAVKWNIEQYQAAKRSETSNIASVETSDANTVVIHLTNWDSSALTSIGYFVYYMSPTAVQKNGPTWAEANPVGTGPYIMKEWQKGVSVKYVKNTNYWVKGEPYLDGINITIINDTMTLESTLQAGEVDMIAYCDLSNLKDLESNKQYVRETNSNGVGVEGVGIIPSSANAKSPWANEKVRQAMCYAIDNESIIKTVGLGYMKTTNQWSAPGSPTYDKNVKGYPYNPDKAKQLLSEAGYPNGFDTTIWSVSSGIYADTCTAVAQQLNAVGIKAKIQVADSTKYSSIMTDGWDGLAIHYNSIGPDVGLYMGRHLDVNGAFYAKGIQHPQDALDLLAKIRTAPDDATKLKYSMEMQELIYDKYALFGKPMAVQSINTLKNTYVKDDNFHQPTAAAWTPWSTWLDK